VQLLHAEGYVVHQTANGQDAKNLIDAKTFDVVVARFRTGDSITGIDVLVHHELVSPGHGKILVTDFISANVDYISSFIGALCVPTETPPDKLLSWIKTMGRP
jgi:DNA-binding NtrC family response regulator